MYSTNSDLKAVLVERFNRTLLNLIKEPMYIEGKACWLSHLDAALGKYNIRVHGTTKTTPFEMSTNINTEKLASRKPIPNLTPNNKKLPNFQV